MFCNVIPPVSGARTLSTKIKEKKHLPPAQLKLTRFHFLAFAHYPDFAIHDDLDRQTPAELGPSSPQANKNITAGPLCIYGVTKVQRR